MIDPSNEVHLADLEPPSAQAEKNLSRYSAAAHATQSGVAIEMTIRPEPTEPKHLRVGINTAMVDHSALVSLLVSKGVFTLDEYVAALADAMEAERARYEHDLSAHFGKTVTLA